MYPSLQLSPSCNEMTRNKEAAGVLTLLTGKAVVVGREILEGRMKAPVTFPNIYSLLDLLPSQAGERVRELLAVPHQRPPQLRDFG